MAAPNCVWPNVRRLGEQPENRYLPSLSEWLSIRTLSSSKDWTDPQRRMMRKAGQVLGLRAVGLAAITAVLGSAYKGWAQVAEADSRLANTAKEVVQQILKVDTPNVTDAIKRIGDYRALDRSRAETVNQGDLG